MVMKIGDKLRTDTGVIAHIGDTLRLYARSKLSFGNVATLVAVHDDGELQFAVSNGYHVNMFVTSLIDFKVVQGGVSSC